MAPSRKGGIQTENLFLKRVLFDYQHVAQVRDLGHDDGEEI
jgi:hypothetical protein